MNEDTLFLPGLSPVGRHEIHARFDGGALSSNGGVLILREIEKRLNFSNTLASCLFDERDPTGSRRTNPAQQPPTPIQSPDQITAVNPANSTCLDEIRNAW